MARTRDHHAHAQRRAAFVDLAQQLIAVKGYEQLSVQELLDQTGSSKGAFYHYFDGKSELLSAVVERMVDAVLETVQPMIDDPQLSAIEKLEGLFGRIGSWKTQRKELLLALMAGWYSDDNALTRERFRREVLARMLPLLSRIVRQGAEEGRFRVGDPQGAADVLIALLLGMNDRAGRLFLDRQTDRVSYEEVVEIFRGFAEAFDRILGLPPGTLHLMDEEITHAWFAEPLLDTAANAANGTNAANGKEH
jgi:AcrR family transcriptional regulator